MNVIWSFMDRNIMSYCNGNILIFQSYNLFPIKNITISYTEKQKAKAVEGKPLEDIEIQVIIGKMSISSSINH